MKEVKARVCETCKSTVQHDRYHWNLEEFEVEKRGLDDILLVIKRYFCGINCLKEFVKKYE